MQKKITKTWHFTQSPQEVWDYLTKPELIALWLMKNDFKPIVGHRFCFTFIESEKNEYAGTVDCEVLEVVRFTKLSYSWNGGTKDKSRTFNSTVEWMLIPKDKGTELHLQHDGFHVLDDMLNHSNGWDTCLKKFEESVNATTR